LLKKLGLNSIKELVNSSLS